MYRFEITNYEIKEATYVHRLNKIVDKAFARARATEWDSVAWKRYRRLQQRLEQKSYLLGLGYATDICRNLKEQIADKKEIESLKAQLTKCQDLLQESKHYGEYLEYSSQSTDDQPRPKGWEYV